MAGHVPLGEGSDLAGVVEELGPDVTGFAVGDEVLGFVDTRASHAEVVVAEVGNLVARPSGVAWDVAGRLFVAGTTAYATVRAVNLTPGDTVVVSGAAGGVGSLAVQLAGERRRHGDRPGQRGAPRAGWRDHGVIPVIYGDGVAERIRAAGNGRVDAFIDTFGGGYVEMAIGLGVTPDRIDTIIDRAAAQEYGTKVEGSAAAANRRSTGRAGRPDRRGTSRDSDRQDLPPCRGTRRPTAISSSVTPWARSSFVPDRLPNGQSSTTMVSNRSLTVGSQPSVQGLSLDVQAAEEPRQNPPLGHATNASDGHDEIPFEVANRLAAIRLEIEVGLAMKQLRVALGSEFGACRRRPQVDMDLLDPQQLLVAKHANGPSG